MCLDQCLFSDARADIDYGISTFYRYSTVSSVSTVGEDSGTSVGGARMASRSTRRLSNSVRNKDKFVVMDGR